MLIPQEDITDELKAFLKALLKKIERLENEIKRLMEEG